MKIRIVLLVLGVLLLVESIFMLFSAIIAIIYGENDILALSLSAGFTAIAGSLLYLLNKNVPRQVGKKEAYLIVTLGWIFLSFFGTIPYIFNGYIPSFTNAFFETISGFTTTGASILNNIEELPHGILFWRSITQWMGGMGIIVLSIAVLPLIKVGGMQLFAAEVPGPTKDKIHPKIKETAKRLWLIYFVLTIVETILLKLGGMNWFDAVCHSLTTMSTGGYSTKQASIAYFTSPYIHYTISFFMLIAGTNFILIYFISKGKLRKVWQNDEFLYYLKIIILSVIIISISLIVWMNIPTELAIRDSVFQVISILTTTGFCTTDYLLWQPAGLWVILLLLMFVGGMAGSTAGGIKIVRIQLLLRNSYSEFKRLLHPNAIIPVRYNKKSINSNIINNIQAFVILYLFIFFISSLIMSMMGLDFSSAVGAVAASLGNIGPGIGSVGPIENYAHIPIAGKWFLSFLMLLGRLELFTVLMIVAPGFWKN
ncbi:MAG TPA: TrkH family potassium uptake protein [Bacteroidales bacterium]|jgi:trk system potassium uptake protein TrkH|nr:TrkH family potassium uptake protein [Bacteroidales bacterium]